MMSLALPILSLLLLAGSLLAAPISPATRPNGPTDPRHCTTAECHADVKRFAVVHAPVASDTCDACHEPADAKAHTFIVRRHKAELCTHCHELSMAGLPVVHKPVADGDCLGCHDPHGGGTRAIVREDSIVDLCGRCHESITRQMTFLHGPVREGACDSCHTPHASQFPKLVDLTGADLCLTCHLEFEPRVVGKKFTHQALKDGCEKCHDVHGSTVAMALHKSPPQLCLDCHNKLSEQISAATVKHSVVMSDRACGECHDPHASDFARLMNAPPGTVCLTCHSKPIKEGEITVAAVAEIADPKNLRHGQLKEGECGGCHAVHGGANPSLLQRPYSRAFYQRFAVDNYELCFGCHDQRLVSDATTSAATGFRDGSRNLHYVHANHGERDKNCRACHLTHAGPNPRLIRDHLRYGTWEMPVQFTKTPTGGSCFPGCHPLEAYDREKPLKATPTTMPSTQPGNPTIARAQHREGRVIAWSVRDQAGTPLQIPDSARPSILLLSAPGDATALADAVHDSIAAAPPAQVVAVLCGQGAAEAAAALAGRRGEWSIVADPANDAAVALDVRALPMVLVLRADGTEVARLPSADPNMTAIKLRPYIEQAAGVATAGTHGHAATLPTAVADQSERRLARDLRGARRLLNEGRAGDALQQLENLPPAASESSADVTLLQAEALLRVNRIPEAIILLERRAFEGPSAERSIVLQARCWLSLRDAGHARNLLEESIARGMSSADVHHILGDAYSDLGDWPKAAEQYRLASQLRQPHE